METNNPAGAVQVMPGGGASFPAGVSAMQISQSQLSPFSPIVGGGLAKRLDIPNQGIHVEGVKSVSVVISHIFIDQQLKALKLGALAKAVTSDASKEIALEALKGVTECSKMMVNDWKAQKIPLQSIIDEGNEKVHAFCGPLDAERSRLSLALGEYALLEEQAAAQAEAERLAELAKDKEEIKTNPGAVAPELRAKIIENSMPIKREKAKGTVLKTDWNYEILDLAGLAKNHPDLGEWVPSTSAIKKALEEGRSIPEIKAEKVSKMHVKK